MSECIYNSLPLAHAHICVNKLNRQPVHLLSITSIVRSRGLRHRWEIIMLSAHALRRPQWFACFVASIVSVMVVQQHISHSTTAHTHKHSTPARPGQPFRVCLLAPTACGVSGLLAFNTSRSLYCCQPNCARLLSPNVIKCPWPEVWAHMNARTWHTEACTHALRGVKANIILRSRLRCWTCQRAVLLDGLYSERPAFNSNPHETQAWPGW